MGLTPRSGTSICWAVTYNPRPMFRVIPVLLLMATFFADEMPAWVLPGVAMRETTSYYHQNRLIYVDRAIGKAGERGPFQCKRIAFRQVALPGERFEDLQWNMDLAQDIATRYLWWLYQNQANRSWATAVAMYNCGPSYDGIAVANAYYRDVRRYGRGKCPAGWGG